MFDLNKRSRNNLKGVHPNLVRVVEQAARIGSVEFIVTCGVRTVEQQKALYAQGRTKPGRKVTWTMNSRHLVNPHTGYGHAVDLCPAPFDFKELEPFTKLAKLMFDASHTLGVPITWGADWDRDGNPRERGEGDNPHFELHF